MLRYFKLAIFFVATAFCLNAVAEIKTDFLQSVSEIRQLSFDGESRNYSVQIEAQVMVAHGSVDGFFIQQDGNGIFVHVPSERGIKFPSIGDIVRIEGVAKSGRFAPKIEASEVVVLANKPLPESRSLWLTDLNMTTSDCAWVNLSGRMIDLTIPDERLGMILLKLELMESVTFSVLVPYSPEAEETLREMIFQRVYVTGILGSVYNGMRQMTGRVLHVNSVKDFQAVNLDSWVSKQELVPIDKLMSYGTNYKTATRTRGVVTSISPNEIYLRGEKMCLRVIYKTECDANVGDVLEVAGFVLSQEISPAFRARTLKVVEKKRVEPKPKVVDLSDILEPLSSPDLLDPSLNYELISIQAELVEVGKAFDSETDDSFVSLLCRLDDHLFEARLPEGMVLDDKFEPQSILELTGICHLRQKKELSYRLFPDGFWLQVRSEPDLKILKSAPWWTPQRLVLGIGFMLIVLVSFFAWVIVLRKTVLNQTETIGVQVHRETMLNERQRIARELHDTLEQGLAALALQLKRIDKRIRNFAPNEIPMIEMAESMLQVCRDESRASIQDLRGGVLEEMELPDAVRKFLSEKSGLEFFVNVSGEIKHLTLFAEQQILRLICESINNAINHANPSHISVDFEYSSEKMVVSVSDDGCGFDLSAAEKKGRFGILGMRERANRLNSYLSILSELGQGTQIRLEVPIKEFFKESQL